MQKDWKSIITFDKLGMELNLYVLPIVFSDMAILQELKFPLLHCTRGSYGGFKNR
jgi:hypothetical protein